MKLDNFNVKVGIRIRNQREKMGYSREKLAELANMSDGYLGEVERGVKGISSHFLYRIAVSLSVTMDELVSDEKDENIIESKELNTIVSFLHKSEQSKLKLIEKIVRTIVVDN